MGFKSPQRTNGGKAPGFRSNAIIDPNAKPENFDELLAHVLKTAPKDSLEDLSGRVQVDFSDDNIMVKEGFRPYTRVRSTRTR